MNKLNKFSYCFVFRLKDAKEKLADMESFVEKLKAEIAAKDKDLDVHCLMVI